MVLPQPQPPAVAAPYAPTPLWDLVEDSFAEAQFLWQRWELDLDSNVRDLAGVAFWTEDRLAGALDGVRLAADQAFEPLLAPALASDDLDQLTVAAPVAATSDSTPVRQALLAIVGGAEGERLYVLRRALELVPSDAHLAPLEDRLARGTPEQRAALVALRAFRRRAPGNELAELLAARDPERRAVGLHAARRAAAAAVLPAVESALGERSPLLRDAAIESALVLGSAAAWAACLEVVRRQTPQTQQPLLLVALLAPEAEQQPLLDALGNETLRRAALFAAGFAGTRAAADAVLAVMDRPADAALAAEAFCAITGLDLGRERLIAPPPPEPEQPIPLPDDDLEADLVETVEGQLDAPDVPGIKRWWEAQRPRFKEGVRHLAGRPVTLAGLHAALTAAPMRRRHALALELAVRTGGHVDVATRAFARVQRSQLRGPEAAPQARAVPSALARKFSPV
jgi:uncharacterized protein (TIGR02270 family)